MPLPEAASGLGSVPLTCAREPMRSGQNGAPREGHLPPTLLTARSPEQGKPSSEQEFLERGISKRLPLRRGQVVRAGGDSRLSWAGGGKLPGQFLRGQPGRVGPWGGSWSRRVGPRGGSAGCGVWGPARLPPSQRGSPE